MIKYLIRGIFFGFGMKISSLLLRHFLKSIFLIATIFIYLNFAIASVDKSTTNLDTDPVVKSSQDPKEIDLYNKGVIEAELHRFQNAISYYKKALKINPNFTHAKVNLGSAYARIGKIKESNTLLNEAYLVDPNDDLIPRLLALNDFAEGKIVSANSKLDLCLKSFPKSYYCRLTKADILVFQHKYEVAQNILLSLHVDNEKDDEVIRRLCLNSMRMLDDASAGKWLSKLKNVSPSNPEIPEITISLRTLKGLKEDVKYQKMNSIDEITTK